MSRRDRASVSVPASSGNVGVGFDVLGLALDFRNEVHVRVLGPGQGAPAVLIEGEGEATLPRDRRNGIVAAIESVFRRAKVPVPRLEVRCVNRIPLARGLGSSSASFLGGLLAGNRLLGDRFDRETILSWATELEGHPDNVAPSLLGGLRASAVFDGRVVTVAYPAPRCRVVVAVPAFELSTKKARKALPKKIPLVDAVFNLAAFALLPRAFEREPALLGAVLNDRWHEPYRAKLVPGFRAVKSRALKAGAYGVTLSGAGPTMAAFVAPDRVASVSRAMEAGFASAGVRSRTMELKIDTRGAIVR